jgi:MoaA/NifB/PqqE/SkfB family radical SAM enzyme
VSSVSEARLEPVLQLHPTRLCNLTCSHCYTSSGPDARGELDAALLGACLVDAFALGYRQLAVSGGEPLLYTGLVELLAQARAVGFRTTLTTNGLLVRPARWEPLAPLLDFVAVSIDGMPAEHDAIRGRAGAFERTVANLATIRASGVPFGVIFTLTQYNVDSLEHVVRLAAEHGACGVQVHPLTVHGRARATMPDARPDGLELVAALSEAERLGAALGIRIHVDALTLEQLATHREHLVPRRPVGRLVDVAPILVVDSHAAVVPLTHEVGKSLWLGSLSDAALPTLAEEWIASGRAEALAEACERTWTELVATGENGASYWYDEVAARASGPEYAPAG